MSFGEVFVGGNDTEGAASSLLYLGHRRRRRACVLGLAQLGPEAGINRHPCKTQNEVFDIDIGLDRQTRQTLDKAKRAPLKRHAVATV